MSMESQEDYVNDQDHPERRRITGMSDMTAYHIGRALNGLHGLPERFREIDEEFIPLLTRLENIYSTPPNNKLDLQNRRRAFLQFLETCVDGGAVRTVIARKVARGGRPPKENARTDGDDGVFRGQMLSRYSVTPSEKRERYGMTSASEIVPRPIEWIAEGFLARRKLTLLSGRGGTGKSQVAIAYIASVTTGSPLPEGGTPAVTGRVLVMAAEDDPEDTVIPRLIAAGADLSKVEILKPREVVEVVEKGKKVKVISPRCLADIDYWNRLIDDFPDVVLIVCDTLPSYLGKGVDDHKNIDVKNALEPFIEEVLSPRGVACLGIVHVGKGPKDKSIDKILGSVAYTNTARVCWTIIEDLRQHGVFILCWMKGNNTPKQSARPFTIAKADARHDDKLVPTSKVVWMTETIDQSADEILESQSALRAKKSARGPAPEKKQSAKNFLVEYLRDHGPTPFKELAKLWVEGGGSRSTLNDAATDLVASKHIKTSGPAHGNIFEFVEMPEPDPEPPAQEPDPFWDGFIDPDDEGEEWKKGPPPE